MPARSEAQRSYLNARFGHAWMRQHGFDNPGKLPEYADGKPHRKRRHARASAVTKMLTTGRGR